MSCTGFIGPIWWAIMRMWRSLRWQAADDVERSQMHAHAWFETQLLVQIWSWCLQYRLHKLWSDQSRSACTIWNRSKVNILCAFTPRRTQQTKYAHFAWLKWLIKLEPRSQPLQILLRYVFLLVKIPECRMRYFFCFEIVQDLMV